MRPVKQSLNIFTIDLEDWLQSSIEVFPATIRAKLSTRPTDRVVANTYKLLDILDTYEVRATWFVLGTVAECFPALIREIGDRGHEIASHGYGHELVYRLRPETFREDLRRSSGVIENACGRKVLGYRAPYFSITPAASWALDVLAELGFRYDSSLFPISRGLYGFPGADRFPSKLANGLFEFPVTTLPFLKMSLPVGGGGYFRLFPYLALRSAYKAVHKKHQQPLVFYMHPYELDGDEFRSPPPAMDLHTRLVWWQQHFNRNRFEKKLKRLLGAFSFVSARQWIEEHGAHIPGSVE